jgi:hypothetical protein
LQANDGKRNFDPEGEIRKAPHEEGDGMGSGEDEDKGGLRGEPIFSAEELARTRRGRVMNAPPDLIQKWIRSDGKGGRGDHRVRMNPSDTSTTMPNQMEKEEELFQYECIIHPRGLLLGYDGCISFLPLVNRGRWHDLLPPSFPLSWNGNRGREKERGREGGREGTDGGMDLFLAKTRPRRL